MDNVVVEDKIAQGEFQQIMGLLANIDSLVYTNPMDMSAKNNLDEDSPSY